MRLIAASTDTGPMAFRWCLRWASAIATIVALMPVMGGVASAPATTSTPAATAPLAATSAGCFGYTARLSLVSTLDTPAPSSDTVRDMRWHLEVSGPPDALTASLDTFTIRGNQANRSNLALVRWSAAGSVGQWSAQGPVRLPSVSGNIQNGDKGRILAWLQTPHGAFGVRGITFDLHPQPDGLDVANLAILATDGCPMPPAATPTH